MMRTLEPENPAAPTQAEQRATIARLASAASIETSTKILVDIDGYASLVPAATDVYVTCLPGTPYHHILGIARRLRQLGMNPVPHIAARRLVNAAVSAEFLARLRDEAGVTRALIIAGDSETAAGDYACSLALLETGLLQAHGIRSVGFAAYPEGHPRISPQALLDTLERKIAYAQSHGIEPFLVSQFCFDGNAVLGWLAKVRAHGLALPVRIGLAGPARIRTLLNYGLRCGIGDSLRAFGSQPVSLTRLLMRHGPEAVLRTVARSAADLGIVGLHFFPFGGFAETAHWIKRVAAGSFRLNDSDAGFTLEGDARASA